MVNRKHSILLMASILVALLLFNVPVFAQQYTYVGHIGASLNAPNNLVAQVMFLESGVIVTQGGVTKKFIPNSTSKGSNFYISTEYKSDSCSAGFSNDWQFMSLMIGTTLYSFQLATNSPSSNANNNSGLSYSNNTTEWCYTCHGLRHCVVCHGTGIYSMYGYSHTCTACNGTGKCWNCHGTGYEP